MEIIYLWIEKYKNIENQGFNLSPRFKCKYNSESKELKIEKKEYKSIFPENINITAIVGENGSGKSSILKNIPNPDNFIGENNAIFIFKENDEIQIITNLKIDVFPNIYEGNITNDIYKRNLDYSTLSYDLLSPEFINDSFAYFNEDPTFNNHFLYNIYKDSNQSIDLREFKFCINKIIYQYKDIDNIFDFKVNKIELENQYSYIETLIDRERDLFENEHLKNKTSYYDALLQLYDDKSSSFEKKIFLFFVLQLDSPSLFFNDIESSTHLFSKKKKEELFCKLDEENKFNLKSELVYLFLKSLLEYESLFNKTLSFDEFHGMLNSILKNINSDDINLEDCINIIFDTKVQYFISIELYDNDIKFNELSQGERLINTTKLFIYDYIQINHDKKNFFFLLDEIDNSLHPNWQKKLLNSIVNTFSKIEDKKFHFIFTSHSPFILSDIPKENCVFLENGKQVYPFKENEQTFGANIHTLLSHGFFMDEGLMGEFAKIKIEEIRDFYKKYNNVKKEDSSFESVQNEFHEKKEKFKHIISLIGEPFLKTIMNNYLDELKSIFNEKEYKKEKLENSLDNFSEEEIEKYLEKRRAKND